MASEAQNDELEALQAIYMDDYKSIEAEALPTFELALVPLITTEQIGDDLGSGVRAACMPRLPE